MLRTADAIKYMTRKTNAALVQKKLSYTIITMIVFFVGCFQNSMKIQIGVSYLWKSGTMKINLIHQTQNSLFRIIGLVSDLQI